MTFAYELAEAFGHQDYYELAEFVVADIADDLDWDEAQTLYLRLKLGNAGDDSQKDQALRAIFALLLATHSSCSLPFCLITGLDSDSCRK